MEIGDQILRFQLGTMVLSVPLDSVREILSRSPITPVPHLAPEVEGVMNLRGRIVPVLSLRKRFGLECDDFEEPTVIVIQNGDVLLGVLVDLVEEVVTVEKELQIVGEENPHVCGIYVEANRVTQVLDLQPLLQR
jgi:purine-binding chemotaxis protein CheW